MAQDQGYEARAALGGLVNSLVQLGSDGACVREGIWHLPGLRWGQKMELSDRNTRG